MNEWMNEWINQSMNQSINRSINQSIKKVSQGKFFFMQISYGTTVTKMPHISDAKKNNDQMRISRLLFFCFAVFRIWSRKRTYCKVHPIRILEQGNYHVIVVTDCSGVQHPMISMLFVPQRISEYPLSWNLLPGLVVKLKHAHM